MLKDKEKLKKIIKFIGIMILLTLFASYPYLEKGVFFAHDLIYHLTRIIETSNELSNGIFPVFIHSELLEGFGYANPIFYPELFIYISILFLKMGFGVLFSYKMLLLITTFMTFLITYYSAFVISKDKKISWITTLLYTMSLYRFVDIYARGALGEVLSFTFLPLILAGIYDIVFGENKRWYLICFAIFGIMNSHILSFAMSVCLILVLCIINSIKIVKDKKKLLNIFLAGVISILLISSYMFTYVEQKAYDKLNVDVHRNSGEYLDSNASAIQEAFSNKLENTDVYTTRSIGILLLFLPISIFFIKDKNKSFKFYLEIYIIGIIIWLMSLNTFPWEKCSFLSIIQFPFRLNILSTLLFSFSSAYFVMNAFENKEDIFKVLVLVILIIAAKHLSEVKINPHSLTYEALMAGPKLGNQEYVPVGFSSDDRELYNIYNPNTKIEYEKKGSKITFKYEDKDNNLELHVPLTYYKGYQAYIVKENGEKVNLDVQKDERNAHLKVKSNEKLTGTITVEYKMTIIQKIGYSISIITLTFLFIYVIKQFLNKDKTKISGKLIEEVKHKENKKTKKKIEEKA